MKKGSGQSKRKTGIFRDFSRSYPVHPRCTSRATQTQAVVIQPSSCPIVPNRMPRGCPSAFCVPPSAFSLFEMRPPPPFSPSPPLKLLCFPFNQSPQLSPNPFDVRRWMFGVRCSHPTGKSPGVSLGPPSVITQSTESVFHVVASATRTRLLSSKRVRTNFTRNNLTGLGIVWII
jgi:hypothetical protein